MKKVYLSGMSVEEIIRLLKEGKEIKYENANLKTKMIDGLICDFEGNDEFTIGSCLQSGHNAFSYFEQEEPFEITETGLYKTRGGKMAFVYLIDGDDTFPISYSVDGSSFQYVATKQGANSLDKESKLDLVSKWEE